MHDPSIRELQGYQIDDLVTYLIDSQGKDNNASYIIVGFAPAQESISDHTAKGQDYFISISGGFQEKCVPGNLLILKRPSAKFGHGGIVQVRKGEHAKRKGRVIYLFPNDQCFWVF